MGVKICYLGRKNRTVRSDPRGRCFRRMGMEEREVNRRLEEVGIPTCQDQMWRRF